MFWAYLLCVSLCIRQLCGDVEHDFLLPEHCVDRLTASLSMGDIKATAKPVRHEKKIPGLVV